MSVLMIVESPVKAKKIRGYFPDFNVIATVGHFKDLPQKSMGIEPPEHRAQWETMSGKEDVIRRIRGAAKTASIIYVATDPDREGEAIGGHVVNLLGQKHRGKIARITYTEITKHAIQKAINHRRAVDWQLVSAQEARRVVDRYVGYMVSPVLSNLFESQGYSRFLSSGRLQSIALRLIVERTKTIKNFFSEENYGVLVHATHKDVSFSAQWLTGLPKGELLKDKAKAELVVAQTSQLTVIDVESKPLQVAPPKPLITSSFCRLMSKRLGLTTKQAMDVAQKLHEAGLITYHRTDSPEVSDDFVKAVWGYASSNKLPLPSTPRVYKAGKNAQEGHECLRVTDINLVSARAAGIDDPVQQKAYQLVWKVSLEAQLANAIDDQRTVTFLNDHGDTFIARAKGERTPGWRNAADRFITVAKAPAEHPEESETNNNEDELSSTLPTLSVNDVILDLQPELVIKHTRPPAVFSEDTLNDQLERLGIGRPSSYAQNIEKLVSMDYVQRISKGLKLESTDLGIAVVEAMLDVFSFMQYDYTALMEECLDDIASGKSPYLPIVNEAHKSLVAEIEHFKQRPLSKDAASALKNCIYNSAGSGCTKKKREHSASNGNKNNLQQKPQASKAKAKPKNSAANAAGEGCKCGGTLSIKSFDRGNNAGKQFVGCSNFPTCRYFEWLQ